MANNRLYIVDKENGDNLYIARSTGEGWVVIDDAINDLQDWLHLRDDASFGTGSGTSLTIVDENGEEQ